MSATTVENQDAAQGPDITILTRVASIPMISSSLGTINEALSSNAYTRFPYNHAKGLTTSAFNLTAPLQVKLAPLIVRADAYANMAVDAVESRYPYPFQVQPADVATYVRDRTQSTSEYVSERVSNVNKAIDEKVKTPAYGVVQDIDQRFAPIMDYVESHLKTPEAGPSTPPDAQYQYQRALALSKTLRENIYEYSNEQLKYLQAQSVIAQKASETASSISSLASTSIASAHGHIHALSDNMLAEIEKLQTSTSSLTTSLQTTFQSSASQIQSQIPQIQQSYADLTTALSSTANEIKMIITTKDLPLQEKVTRVGKEVQERVSPLLETVKKGVSEVLARSKTTPQEAPPTPPENGSAIESYKTE